MTEPAANPPRSSWQRWLLLALLAAVIGGFVLFGPNKDVLFSTLQERKSALKEQVEQIPIAAPVIFFVVYVAVTALSLPAAFILTLAGGFLFGLWWGSLLISFASTAGATLAFLSTRYILRDWMERRFGDKLATLNRGVETEGGYYLFTLRLVPLFPFFVINAAMGLTRMRVFTFWWVSQLGMLPGTLIYVNAGTELGNIDKPGDILSPRLLLAFVLLGTAPLLFRWLVKWLRPKPAAGT